LAASGSHPNTPLRQPMRFTHVHTIIKCHPGCYGRFCCCLTPRLLGKCTLAHRSICSHYVNPHFKVSKNSKLNFYMYI
jgi:hypothetical protein